MPEIFGKPRHLALGLAYLVSAAMIVPAISPTYAESVPFCRAGESPHFVFGFADLQRQLGSTMGDPTECEHSNADNGDTLQATSSGLAFYRKGTNTPTFTDGSAHWALTNQGLVSWSGGDVDPPGVGAQPDYTNPVIAAPAEAGTLTCRSSNPSCGRDPWWLEWTEIADSQAASERVQFEFLQPGLVSEARYVESVWMLWQWPEGRDLLQRNAAAGLGLVTAPPGTLTDAFAGFSAPRRAIFVNSQFSTAPTWMLTDVIAHEMKHAADARAGVAMDPGAAACLERERRAYQVEADYLTWLAGLVGSLPAPGPAVARLSVNHLNLYRSLFSIGTAADPAQLAERDYRGHCI